MGASDDEDDYIIYGAPLREEQETVAGQHKRDVQDPALTRALPVWQQEATDAQGRHRLHGAFTGGYSAGYFNTVGSKEGWAPTSYTSSREQRAQSKGQSAEDFMDEDELEELDRNSLQTRTEYDTFGHAASERARKAVQQHQGQRLGLLDLVPDELLAPVPDSAGIRLLQKMGWRQGKGVGKMTSASAGERPDSKWGVMASIGTENTAIYTVATKNDTYGLGFDPFKGAEDFRAAKRARDEPQRREPPTKRQTHGVAFGTGIMDEDDVYGLTDDYITEPESRGVFNFEVQSDEEGDNMNRQGGVGRTYLLPGRAEHLRLQSKEEAQQKYDLVPGFVRAKHAEHHQHFAPPAVPPDFRTVHTFPVKGTGLQAVGPEPRVPSQGILRTIRTLAPFVARMGSAFEALALQKNAGNPAFSFLFGGEGAEYYHWQLRALKAAAKDTSGLAIGQRTTPLTTRDRAELLGEEALAGSSALASKVPNPPADPTATRIADGDRQALQETLQQTFARGRKQDMGTEGAAGASYGLRPGKPAVPSHSAAQKVLETAANRFASSGTYEGGEQQAAGLVNKAKKQPEPQNQAKTRAAPMRTVEEWRPSPLLCKRFNVPDPFRGKAALVPEAPRFKMDAISLPETAAAAAAPKAQKAPLAAKVKEEGPAVLPLPSSTLPPPPPHPEALPPPPQKPQPAPGDGLFPDHPGKAQTSAPLSKTAEDSADAFLDSLFLPSVGGLQGAILPAPPAAAKPIDLFKAIFEDGEDDEEVSSDDKPAILPAEHSQPAFASRSAAPSSQAVPMPPSSHDTKAENVSHRSSAQLPMSDIQAPPMDPSTNRDGGSASEPSPHANGDSAGAKEGQPSAAEVQEALALLGKIKKKDRKKHGKEKERKEKKREKQKKKKGHKGEQTSRKGSSTKHALDLSDTSDSKE